MVWKTSFHESPAVEAGEGAIGNGGPVGVAEAGLVFEGGGVAGEGGGGGAGGGGDFDEGVEDADGVGQVGNAKCGDMMRMSIKVEDGRISDVKFKTFGCGAAIATSSVAPELIKGKTLEQARALTNRDVVEQLGGLPPVKIHCSVLAEEALRAALDDYESKNK